MPAFLERLENLFERHDSLSERHLKTNSEAGPSGQSHSDARRGAHALGNGAGPCKLLHMDEGQTTGILCDILKGICSGFGKPSEIELSLNLGDDRVERVKARNSRGEYTKLMLMVVVSEADAGFLTFLRYLLSARDGLIEFGLARIMVADEVRNRQIIERQPSYTSERPFQSRCSRIPERKHGTKKL